MDKVWILIIGYVAFLNIYLYYIMGKDKEYAKKRMPRIPESHFMTFSILGGALGCMLGMYHFRHKTQHNKFRIGLPAILVVHIALILLIIGVLT